MMNFHAFIKYTLLLSFLQLFFVKGFCQDTKAEFFIPDSIKAVAFYADISVKNSFSKNNYAGIIADGFRLELTGKKQRSVNLNFDKNAKSNVVGLNVTTKRSINSWKGIYTWDYNWKENQIYSLLFLAAVDSTTNSSIYSGYILLPEENKWKLIASEKYSDTHRITQAWPGVSGELNNAIYTNRWLLRSNGTWKALDSQTTKPPVLRHMSNIDSLYQQKLEEDLLRSKLPKDSVNYEDGVFYQSLKEGTGRLVKVTDTLTVHYKGSLYSDGSVFDQTKEKPATFPLERLIKGWQLGLVHCKVGGKMRLYITSASAYGIRTRSANIPPNSILVFDVEVLDAKEKIIK